jgi:hypothetical protein
MSARVTGVQVAIASVAALLESWREVLGPREFVVVLDLVARLIARELEQQERARGRWVA